MLGKGTLRIVSERTKVGRKLEPILRLTPNTEMGGRGTRFARQSAREPRILRETMLQFYSQTFVHLRYGLYPWAWVVWVVYAVWVWAVWVVRAVWVVWVYGLYALYG